VTDEECGAVGGMGIGRGNRSIWMKPTRVPLRPHTWAVGCPLWKDTYKINVREIGWGGMDWINLVGANGGFL
jgi:hypothetical protein